MDEHVRYFSKRKPLKCPQCGEKKVASILYGMVSPELGQSRDLDKLFLVAAALLPPILPGSVRDVMRRSITRD